MRPRKVEYYQPPTGATDNPCSGPPRPSFGDQTKAPGGIRLVCRTTGRNGEVFALSPSLLLAPVPGREDVSRLPRRVDEERPVEIGQIVDGPESRAVGGRECQLCAVAEAALFANTDALSRCETLAIAA